MRGACGLYKDYKSPLNVGVKVGKGVGWWQNNLLLQGPDVGTRIYKNGRLIYPQKATSYLLQSPSHMPVMWTLN